MKIVKKCIVYFLCLIFKCFPIKRNTILFYSVLNQYNDNSKYVAEKIHLIDRNLKLVWVEGRYKTFVPNYFVKVKYGSIKYYYYVMTCICCFDNGFGLFSTYVNRRISTVINKILKRNDRILISSWHGTPLKQIIADDKYLKQHYGKLNFSTINDYFVFGSEYEKRIMSSFINDDVKTLLTGYPRNDILFNYDKKKQNRAKEILNWNIDEKYILYAPTFRDYCVNKSGIIQLKRMIDENIIEILEKRFGGNWHIAFRAHQMVLNLSKFDEDRIDVIDANEKADMQLYLLACDGLISDYSSSVFDYIFTRKPCFIYADDFSEYKDKRGLYYDIRKIGLPSASNINDFKNVILKFDYDNYNKNIDNIINKYGLICDGCSSEKIADKIIEYIKEHE